MSVFGGGVKDQLLDGIVYEYEVGNLTARQFIIELLKVVSYFIEYWIEDE